MNIEYLRPASLRAVGSALYEPEAGGSILEKPSTNPSRKTAGYHLLRYALSALLSVVGLLFSIFHSKTATPSVLCSLPSVFCFPTSVIILYQGTDAGYLFPSLCRFLFR